mmetsp:Transcript_3456/g.8677  ORF Transcript_3456/g.8677 Transcript_3456/m.8677 type:complete len:260 (-) Transcript_3456:1270-2049(-)
MLEARCQGATDERAKAATAPPGRVDRPQPAKTTPQRGHCSGRRSGARRGEPCGARLPRKPAGAAPPPCRGGGQCTRPVRQRSVPGRPHRHAVCPGGGGGRARHAAHRLQHCSRERAPARGARRGPVQSCWRARAVHGRQLPLCRRGLSLPCLDFRCAEVRPPPPPLRSCAQHLPRAPTRPPPPRPSRPSRELSPCAFVPLLPPVAQARRRRPSWSAPGAPRPPSQKLRSLPSQTPRARRARLPRAQAAHGRRAAGALPR